MKCPMCGLGEEHQVTVEDNDKKTQCNGCLTKFFDREK